MRICANRFARVRDVGGVPWSVCFFLCPRRRVLGGRRLRVVHGPQFSAAYRFSVIRLPVGDVRTLGADDRDGGSGRCAGSRSHSLRSSAEFCGGRTKGGPDGCVRNRVELASRAVHWTGRAVESTRRFRTVHCPPRNFRRRQAGILHAAPPLFTLP